MADDYRTDDEQIEAIKSWWQENGTSTVITVILAVSSVFGWQQWQQRQQGGREEASSQYQELLDAVGQTEQSESLRSTADHLASELKDKHSSSTYAHFAALQMAKIHVEDNKLAEAKTQLQWILDNRAPDPAITSLARLRLARVVFAESGAKDAMAVIDNVEAGVYQAAYAEFRGDLWDELGDLEKAEQHYNVAREAGSANAGSQNSLLDMKYKSVARRIAAATPTAAAEPTAVAPANADQLTAESNAVLAESPNAQAGASEPLAEPTADNETEEGQ